MIRPIRSLGNAHMQIPKKQYVESEFTHETQRTSVIGWIEREYNKERRILTRM
jgi:hypothetical protein